MRVLFSPNFASKFCENKTLVKISEFTVRWKNPSEYAKGYTYVDLLHEAYMISTRFLWAGPNYLTFDKPLSEILDMEQF